MQGYSWIGTIADHVPFPHDSTIMALPTFLWIQAQPTAIENIEDRYLIPRILRTPKSLKELVQFFTYLSLLTVAFLYC